MKPTDINLKELLQFDPAAGKITLAGDRMLIFRQDSLAVLYKLLFNQVGTQLASGILSQFGHACGHGDFQTMDTTYTWENETDRLVAGPIFHSWEGIVGATPDKIDFDRETNRFHMLGTWHNSYEAEIHLQQSGISDHPICHALTGYASGWCTAFFNRPLISIETQCMGMGADCCKFEIRLSEEWGPEADPWKTVLEVNDYSLSAELERKILLIEEQAAAISELSTPVMEIWDDILVLPIVGVVDTRRSMEIMTNLLERIVNMQSKCVIIDVTGVEVVDTKTADYLLRVVRAALLLGTRCVLTGLSPAVAQTIVEIGADLSEVTTLRNLKEGLKDCLAYLRKQKMLFKSDM